MFWGSQNLGAIMAKNVERALFRIMLYLPSVLKAAHKVSINFS